LVNNKKASMSKSMSSTGNQVHAPKKTMKSGPSSVMKQVVKKTVKPKTVMKATEKPKAKPKAMKPKRAERPSPSASATLFPVGAKKKGNDGNMWSVAKNAAGIQRWVKVK